MYQGKKQKFDWGFTLWLGDLLVIVLAYPTVMFLADRLLGGNVPLSGLAEKNLPLLFIYAVTLLLTLRKVDAYSWNVFSHPLRHAARLAVAFAVAGAILLTFRLLFGAQARTVFPERLLLFSGVCFFFVLGMRVLLRVLLMNWLQLIPVERIAFVGWSPRMRRVLKCLEREMGDFQVIVGYFSDTNVGDDLPPERYTNLGHLEEMDACLPQLELSVIYVTENKIRPEDIRPISLLCGKYRIGMKIIPSAFNVFSSRLSLRLINGIPVLGILGLAYDQFTNRAAKRTLDFVGAVFGLLVSAPIIGILAIMIRRESPGPIFFRQVRVGINGKLFEIIKLRSMRMDAEQATGVTWAVENDPRRLRIGKFMREWNLDELPQFWNVLTGEMSLVGPRPERPEFVSIFEDKVSYYNMRQSLKPGLTGWAAVHGLRGNTSLDDRIAYDLYYIEHWSLWLDIQIIFRTLLPPQNAY
jgi:exopolysaccharide biosynthesis polyprenyl glycosylphosphotransferase